MKRSFVIGALWGIAVIACLAPVGLARFAASDNAGVINAGPAVSTTIVISQAYGGGGGSSGTYTFDYVELKNLSSSPQSLNGLSLMYGSSAGQFGSSSSNVFALPNVTLQPGQYYLVQLSTAGTGGAAFPVPADAVTTNLSMAAANGKVALTNGLAANSCGATATPCALPNAQIVDLVAWGTANNAEGGASTNAGAALTSTQGNVRKNGGCTDTDNNNSDFDIVTNPVPRNSSSTSMPCGGPAVNDVPVDINADGKTDWSVVRETSGQYVWYLFINGGNPQGTVNWGTTGDRVISGDYDGDLKDDIAVFRPSDGTFYILQSGTFTIRIDQFGQSGDDPTVVGDYNNDGKDDVAVWRSGTQATWFYKTAQNANFIAVDWGQTGDRPAPGDYDGDGNADFGVYRAATSTFYKRTASGSISSEIFTFPGGPELFKIVPGDYDGDGKTDIAIAGITLIGNFQWHFRPSGTPGTDRITDVWGQAGDLPVQGDYTGDGKTDYAVWRPSNGTFYVMTVGTRNIITQQWGQNGDLPVATYNAH